MKTLSGLLIIFAGQCLMTGCSESDSENLTFMNSIESSSQNLEWTGMAAGSSSKVAVIITIKQYESATITHIPEWIMVEGDNAVQIFEGDAITSGQRLWIYPHGFNKGEQRCDAVTVKDAANNILRICVGQCACEQMQNDLPEVSVNAATEGRRYLMTLENASATVTYDDSTLLIAVQFIPVNPNYSYKGIFNANFYIYRNGLFTDSGEVTLINMAENNMVIKMSENASSGDAIDVILGENYQ